MNNVTFVDHSTVDLKRHLADDDYVLEAMLVSTLHDDEVAGYEAADKHGKINFLMKNRHGSPFEHTFFTFRVEAPIFVFREWHRHRIGISINEASARYTVLPGQFYIPPRERPLVQVGKAGAYTFEQGTDEQWSATVNIIKQNSVSAYDRYEVLLALKIAKEIARACLSVNIFSQMYWSCNARSLMAFLSLRTQHPAFWEEEGELDLANGMVSPKLYVKNPEGAQFPSKPQWEIARCADIMEAEFARLMPLTYRAFCNNGRVAP